MKIFITQTPETKSSIFYDLLMKHLKHRSICKDYDNECIDVMDFQACYNYDKKQGKCIMLDLL